MRPRDPAAAPAAGLSPSAPAPGGGFLQQALTAAAGVARGALLFEGISSLFHQSPGPFGGALVGYPGATPGPQVVEDPVLNNSYDDPRGGATTPADAGPTADGADANLQQADYDPGGNDPFGSDASDMSDDQWSGERRLLHLKPPGAGYREAPDCIGRSERWSATKGGDGKMPATARRLQGGPRPDPAPC
jgi:hypothetical protein